MKNIRTHLQQQYNKLQTRINKAIKSGKFYQYTAYKQQQLQARLQRYALQLRQLAKGVAVCAALGVALPASAQYTPPGFLMHDGASNPLEVLVDEYITPVWGQKYTLQYNIPRFVDIDGDGDLDVFIGKGNYYDYNNMEYHENTGTAAQPQFSATPSVNPIPSVGKQLNTPFCADIDNDGDLDCFAFNKNAYYDSIAVYYFENQGTATTPAFVQQTGSLNPMDSVNYYLNNVTGYFCAGGFINFDGDADIDAYMEGARSPIPGLQTTGSSLMLLKNVGTTTAPLYMPFGSTNFSVSAAMNPFSVFNANGKVNIVDMDKDGDLDIFKTPTGALKLYYENTGDATNPNYAAASTISPLDSIMASNPITASYTFADIDNDGDLDVFGYIDRTGDPNSEFNFVFFENLDTTITTSVNSLNKDEQLQVYPNPTSGLLQFDRPVSGYLRCYNQLGQVFVDTQLREDTQIDLSQLSKGVYFVSIENKKARIRKKIVID